MAGAEYEDTKDEIDFERISLLLSIVEGITKIAPGYTVLLNAAMSEIKEINDRLEAAAAEEAKENKRRGVVGGQPIDMLPATEPERRLLEQDDQAGEPEPQDDPDYDPGLERRENAEAAARGELEQNSAPDEPPPSIGRRL